MINILSINILLFLSIFYESVILLLKIRNFLFTDTVKLNSQAETKPKLKPLN